MDASRAATPPAAPPAATSLPPSPAPSAPRVASPLAPLWARVMLAAGWGLLCLRALRALDAPAAVPAAGVVRLALLPVGAIGLGAVLACGEPRPTARAVNAYALAALFPALAALALPDLEGAYRVGPLRWLVATVGALACLGGVTAARALPRAAPGRGASWSGAPGVRAARAFAGGAIMTPFLCGLVGCCIGALLPGLQGAGTPRDALGVLLATAPVIVALEVVSWDARTRSDAAALGPRGASRGAPRIEGSLFVDPPVRSALALPTPPPSPPTPPAARAPAPPPAPSPPPGS